MRVLLVEDDRQLARMLDMALTHNGHELDHADDYDHAVRLIDGHDAVVLDMLLGDGHLGSELISAFHCPVILFTSLDNRAMSDYGVDLDDLKGQVYHVLKGHAAPSRMIACLEGAVRARELLSAMLTADPNSPGLDVEEFVRTRDGDDFHARDLELMRAWLDLPAGGKTREQNADYLQLLDEVRAYLGKK